MMRSKLWQTFNKVESIIMSNPQSLSVDIIKHVLMGRYNMTLMPQLAQCKDTSDILLLVQENSSLDDISMLECLVTFFNIHEAKPAIKEYTQDIEKLKLKLCQYLEEELLKASSIIKYVTIFVDEDAHYLKLEDVERLSSAVLSRYIKLNVIRDVCYDDYDDYYYDSMWYDWETESLTDIDVGPTVQSKYTTLTTEVPAGTTEPVSHSYQEEEDTKDEDQVMLLQEKVESIQKQLEEEKELHEKEKQFHEQVIKKYKEEILQQKRDLILKEERIATLAEQQEEVMKRKTERYEESRSDNNLTHKQLEELQKKLKEEEQTSSNFMKQKEYALREKEKLQVKIDDLQQDLELQQAKDHKEVSVQCDYTITESGLHELPTGHIYNE
ncbi:PREDICTED: trichohyalin-like isoform X1 [Amphimedon queenslandica]|uniref:Uncharacterized protein n=3 Tax=Amphimedon queenslandica TaxID=400682 RepID=A0AAN0K0T5_AMPQE|nr:PREDICTED: trichohyalin-like isoform X1 [Amphimedon queenslandica]|eukprot:XP_019862961.1 PREDICTED: trichohyalin-like isoform X1 [Amphimedon queenslandica]